RALLALLHGFDGHHAVRGEEAGLRRGQQVAPDPALARPVEAAIGLAPDAESLGREVAQAIEADEPGRDGIGHVDSRSDRRGPLPWPAIGVGDRAHQLLDQPATLVAISG